MEELKIQSEVPRRSVIVKQAVTCGPSLLSPEPGCLGRQSAFLGRLSGPPATGRRSSLSLSTGDTCSSDCIARSFLTAVSVQRWQRENRDPGWPPEAGSSSHTRSPTASLQHAVRRLSSVSDFLLRIAFSVFCNGSALKTGTPDVSPRTHQTLEI